MNASDDDGLLHALESHSEKEKSCDLEVAREIDKDLAKSSDFVLLLFLFSRMMWWHCKCTSLLQVFYRVPYVSIIWRLNGSS